MVLYEYYSNAILAEPIKNMQDTTICDDFLNIHNILKSRGSHPKVYMTENECSSDLKEAMKKYTIYFQLDPPHMHRRNAEERSIRTCKNNFISGLTKTDPDLPISEWDQLLPQLLITSNILRNYRVNQDLSAYAYLFGIYDFNKYPMVPPGTHVIVHKKPENRTSWGHNVTLGWYIGPSLDHYRCMQCYMPATGIVIITYTLKYISKAFASPKTTT